ncbi:MAG TPA: hypothetical protein ENJ28_10020 [Gammaproteobacteria bacterium]|nr:hypothetical protein [Gammaproteobacteria bacterium]
MTITIYADSNIYRYVASGELEITTIGSIRFAYSSVHFDEMIRSGNTEMLRGIEALKAVPLVTNENGEYDLDDIDVCLEYEDPYENFKRYKTDIEDIDDAAESSIHELLLTFLGADNYEELKKVPSSIVKMALDAAACEDIDAGDLIDRASETAKDLGDFIEKDLSKQLPLSETRKAFGFPKGTTSTHGNDNNPIDGIWEFMKNKVGDTSKDQFFGFEAIPGVEVEQSRLGSVSGCHLILNMIGFHPDKGLPKRDKIRNIMSDGQHVGYASLCGGFLTSDYRLYKKAQAIFEYREFPTTPIHVQYDAEKMSTTLVEPGAIKRFKLERS